MLRTRGLQRLLALFFAGMTALNYPLLALWDPQASIFGLPLFPAALFLLWTVLIASMAWLLENAGE